MKTNFCVIFLSSPITHSRFFLEGRGLRNFDLIKVIGVELEEKSKFGGFSYKNEGIRPD